MFSIHYSLFNFFNQKEKFRLLVSEIEDNKMIFNPFFLSNCYTYFHEPSKNMTFCLPSLEECITLDDMLELAPNAGNI